MEKIYASPVKNYLQRNGFVMVSNLLIDFQQELGITELELSFIIKIMKNVKGYAIHDRDLDPTVCSRTLSRRRNSLRDKGLLNFSTIKEQDPKTGTFSTKGISYDLSLLEERLQEISDKIEEGRVRRIKEEIKDSNYIVENGDSSPLERYQKDYKKTYGKDYILTEAELKKYNELSDEEKQMIGYIFAYCKDRELFGKIIPKLALFFKVKFRFDDLKEYCFENGFISVSSENEKEDLTELIKETYFMYYNDLNDNYAFYKAVERIVNRNAKNGKLPNGIEKLLDKSYKDTYDKRKII